MAIFTSSLVLRTNALLHFYAAHLLLVRPDALPSQNLVVLLGNSMRLPDPSRSAFSQAGAASALAGLILIVLSLSDLVSTFLSASAYDEVWSLLSILRGSAYLLTAAWIYITGKQSTGSFSAATGLGSSTPGWGDELKNSVVFSWTFVQASIMFWVYVILKDEQRKATEKQEEERKALENRL